MDPEKRKMFIPAAVKKESLETYKANYLKATHKTGRLMLFAGDQKVEHLNKDFFGEGISEDDSNPEHLFRIADKARIGCFATQLGLISRYGSDYPEIPYLVKLNSKTNLVKKDQKDPLSRQLISVEDVVEVKESSGLQIVGVGYTVYLGSEFEDVMLTEAAQIVLKAHRSGLITALWVYPRGKAVKDEKDPHLIAGAAGVASALGSDFVKVNPPKKDGVELPELLIEVVAAAGRTGVVCAGGSSENPRTFFRRLYDQIHIGGTSGNATGRNVHQKNLADAVKMCNAISAITFDDADVDAAMKIYEG